MRRVGRGIAPSVTFVAAASLLAALPVRAVPAPLQGVKVAVVELRSPVLPTEEMEAATRRLAAALASDPMVRTIDAAAALEEKGDPRWLEADALLFEAKRDLEELRHAAAVEKLGQAAELQLAAAREFTGRSGRRRLHETWITLGQARLEQGQAREAMEAFGAAVAIDPGFSPDRLRYAPDLVTRYGEARAALGRLDVAPARKRLEMLAATVGADVVVTGVVWAEGGRRPMELLVLDLRRGSRVEERLVADGGDRDALFAAVDRAAPKIVAQILDRPWPPRDRSAARSSATVGLVAGLSSGARLDHGVEDVGEAYRWRGTLRGHGIQASLEPRRGPRFSAAVDLTLLLPARIPDGGWERPSSAEGRFLFVGGGGVRLLARRERGGYEASGGLGLRAEQAVAALSSNNTSTGVSFTWLAAVATAGLSRDLAAGAFVKVEAAAEYDLSGRALSPWTWQSVVAGGLRF